jgi:hypothetical protein
MYQAFYDFVRGRSNVVPPGYELKGLKVYRYLVYLGASQMIEACFPALREQMTDQQWQSLIKNFVETSQWHSNFYGDLEYEFLNYLQKAAQSTLV